MHIRCFVTFFSRKDIPLATSCLMRSLRPRGTLSNRKARNSAAMIVASFVTPFEDFQYEEIIW
jgi:hypothetical protein